MRFLSENTFYYKNYFRNVKIIGNLCIMLKTERINPQRYQLGLSDFAHKLGHRMTFHHEGTN